MTPFTAARTGAPAARRDGAAGLSHPCVIVRHMVIDCDECVMQATAACDDCVVTHILGREPGHAVVLDLAEERALRTMTEAGLVPGLLHLPRAMTGRADG